MASFVVTNADRELFTTCRRAWDYGAGVRRALVPATPRVAGLGSAVRHALAVHYFPGMWAWKRDIVRPLVWRALEETLSAGQAAGRLVEAEEVLGAYLSWAAERDEFTPLRVDTDFDVPVPDPERPELDLSTPDGRGVRFSGRIEMLVVDDDERQWLVKHRLHERGEELDPIELLVLDEQALSSCWGWERLQLAETIAGTIFDQLLLAVPERGGARFSRTVIEWRRSDRNAFHRRLAALVREMSARELSLYPSPSEAHCRTCVYRAPCRLENDDGDVEPLLATDYRRRTEGLDGPARLGSATWSLGRGAAPPFSHPTRR